MKKNKLINFLNPNSEKNLDKNISFYKKALIDYQTNIDFDLREKAINETLDAKTKHVLKIEFKEDLKKAYQDYRYESLKDSIDKAW